MDFSVGYSLNRRTDNMANKGKNTKRVATTHRKEQAPKPQKGGNPKR